MCLERWTQLKIFVHVFRKVDGCEKNFSESTSVNQILKKFSKNSQKNSQKISKKFSVNQICEKKTPDLFNKLIITLCYMVRIG